VIPTKDRPEHVTRAVRSVLAQTVPDFEVIVVNGGLQEPELPTDGRVRIVKSERMGVSAARNIGIRTATGEYLTFLDDDDVYRPERLVVPPVSLSLCMTSVIGEERFFARRAMKSPNVGQVTIKRELCPPFDEELSRTEDADWWLSIVSDLQPVELPFIGHELSDDAPNRLRFSSSPEETLACILRLLDKHPAYFSMHPDAAAYNWKRAAAIAPGRRRKSLFLWRALRLRTHAGTMARLVRAITIDR
jgi:glycosyltransferase involved in cell wall biosynthesis